VSRLTWVNRAGAIDRALGKPRAGARLPSSPGATAAAGVTRAVTARRPASCRPCH